MRLLFLFVVALISPMLTSANTLSIEGNGEVHTLTIAELQAMPETSYITPLPWTKGESKFTGVRLSYLLQNTIGAIPEKVSLRALNDYAAVIIKSDIQQYEPIIAYLRDGETMRIRDKGPYWLIYSLAKHPELDTPKYQGQMVWQLESIKVLDDDK
ncbi:oxidoreductase [Vibrio sp. HN007]|uniref:oxidoreductase n=1 Tax=Vibrio iocasae TaxID=3098914 RepID=UPI0035D44403